MYYKGEGTPQNFVMAHMLFNIAAASGHIDTAKFTRDDVADKMTPNQIEKAQKLAREWMGKY
ncbi:SEL1-like repeat protein [Gammaproteobacteria bacterium]|nr:SEL1-like repeat protein [Gammaproteobacteria bacterium]